MGMKQRGRERIVKLYFEVLELREEDFCVLKEIMMKDNNDLETKFIQFMEEKRKG